MPYHQPPPAPRGFLRGMAMTIGILIMAGSGLCSAGFLVSTVGDMLTDTAGFKLTDFGMVLGMIAAWGGVPFLFGWLIWRASRRPKT